MDSLVMGLLLNAIFSILAGLACAVLPYLIGRFTNRVEAGTSRAKAIVVIVSLAGIFMQWGFGLMVGIFASIVFSIGIAFTKPDSEKAKISEIGQ